MLNGILTSGDFLLESEGELNIPHRIREVIAAIGDGGNIIYIEKNIVEVLTKR